MKRRRHMSGANAFVFYTAILAICLWPSRAISKQNNTYPPLKFVDIHSHVFRTNQTPDDILGFMKRNNISVMALSGYPYLNRGYVDDAVRNITTAHPDVLIPFLRGFPLTAPESVAYVQSNIERGPFRGVGELIINGHGTALRGDSEVLMEIYKVASEMKVPVLVHWTIGSNNREERGEPIHFQQLKNALLMNRNTIFILAHCGAGPPPQKDHFGSTLDELLSANPNLYLDIAGMLNDLTFPGGKPTALGEAILSMMRRYPDRFLTGFDVGDDEHPFDTKFDYAGYYGAFLSRLPRKIAERVAFKNAETLLGIKTAR